MWEASAALSQAQKWRRGSLLDILLSKTEVWRDRQARWSLLRWVVCEYTVSFCPPGPFGLQLCDRFYFFISLFQTLTSSIPIESISRALIFLAL